MSIEIPLKRKYTNRPKGTQKSKHNDGGSAKKKMELGRGVRERAQAVTKANVPTLVLDGPRLRRRWVRPSR